MHCSIQNVLDYCARKLPLDTAAELERHMRVCAECKSLAGSQQQVWQALDMWQAMTVSADFDRKLHARIDEFEGRSWWRWFWRPAMSFSAACAAIAVVLVVYTPANRPSDARIEVEPEAVERALEDLEMLKQLSVNGGQTI